MPFLLEPFADHRITPQDLSARLAWLRHIITPRLQRYLGYYRNNVSELAADLPCGPACHFPMKPFRQYQEMGLPARITGFRRSADGASSALGPMDAQRKEVVIENDIAWRIDTLVDFAASAMPAIVSTAPNPARRAILTRAVHAILDAAEPAGAAPAPIRLLQQLVLQGAIAGSAWLHLRPLPALLQRLASPPAADPDPAAPRDLTPMRQWFALEVLPTRCVCPIPAENAPAALAILRDEPRESPSPDAAPGILGRLRAWLAPASQRSPCAPDDFSCDLFSPSFWQRYDRGILRDQGPNPLGLLPFVRYENAPDPAAATGVGPRGSQAVDVGTGDVEPLIGLQDELNTRLSDRAYRVTMSSFRMFLGTGIEDFIRRPVGPGQMWASDNPDARIQAFGGDSAAPSEDAHVNEIREALDKVSGVSPVAAGLIRGKLGNLTSAVALRLTLIALLARTQRKRAALAATLSAAVGIALEILHRAAILPSDPEERAIDINWPSPLPESDFERLREAQAKLALGIPRHIILAELGYEELAAPS